MAAPGRSIHHPRLRSLALMAAVALAAGLGLNPPPGLAATPGSGTVGPSNPNASWTGPAQTAVTNGPTDADCTAANAYCDDFVLTVSVGPSYWDTHSGGVDVQISWEVGANDFDLYVYRDAATCTNEVDHSAGSAPGTSEDVFVPAATGTYCVRVVYFTTVASGYSGRAEFSSKAGAGGVVFDTTPVTFSPATIVSAHFLGSEPQTTIERRVPGSEPGATDPRRIFVDWPLSSRTLIGQLSRSTDSGASFRLIYDPTCAQRSRPNCATGGGGDTEDDVNLINGHVLFADQEVVAQEAYAHSSDHGDTFVEQQAATNTAAGVDRQWLTVTDNSFGAAGGGPTLEGFMTYHVPVVGQYVHGIDEATGVVLPQPAPQIPDVAQSGQPRVDNNPSSPGYQWIYQPFNRFSDGSTSIATAHGPDYASPTAWQTNLVNPDGPTSFTWVAIDRAGNAYVTWDTGGQVFYSFSSIHDRANDPSLGGRPGTSWSPALEVTLPTVGSAVFPEVIAGDAGRIAVVYDGTTQFTGEPDDAPPDTLWDTYAVVVRNATANGGPPVASAGTVSHRRIHQGDICTAGTACLTTGRDRSLLDMIDVGVYQDGRVGVVFTDNNSTFAQDPPQTTPDESPFTHWASQTGGPILFGSGSTGGPITSRTVPAATRAPAAPPPTRADQIGDATWPNTSAGTNLPGLDIVRTRIEVLPGGDLMGHIELSTATRQAMQQALAGYNATPQTTPAAQRLTYVLRFSTGTEIYHLDAEFRPDRPSLRFYAGRLDENDRITNPSSGAVVAAGYHADPGFTPRGVVTPESHIHIRIPLSQLGFGPGTRLFSVTGFTMAGPLEADESLLNMMRTVDAAPPFDARI